MFKGRWNSPGVIVLSISFYLLLLSASSILLNLDLSVGWFVLGAPTIRNGTTNAAQNVSKAGSPSSSEVVGPQSAENVLDLSKANSPSSYRLIKNGTGAQPFNNGSNLALQHSKHSSRGTTDGPMETRFGYSKTNFKSRRSYQLQEINPDCDQFMVSRKPAIYGIRSDEAEKSDDGSILVKAHHPIKVFLIGRNLYSNLSVALTPSEGSPQDDCTHSDRVKSLLLFNISLNVAEVYLDLPYPGSSIPLYFCLRESGEFTGWYHQGSDPWLRINVEQVWLPTYMKLIVIAILLGFSGVFSGLNLGLMALDKNELQVIMKCGSDDEKRYAKTIEPVRNRGNYLLCSILFSNTLVNSTVSVLLEEISTGAVAIMSSTILIVMFGEILPQAFCSRHGLAVGAKTVLLTKICMIFTCPLSYPVSYCLDWALGEEIGHAYDRERLMEFIQITRDVNNLETDEVNIISGALKIKSIKVKDVMTSIDDVAMLDETAVLNFQTISTIHQSGYSRIPVHRSGDRKDVISVLFAKDLALVDPDDNTPVTTMISFYDHPIGFFDDEMTLDKALKWFKDGKSHIALVRRVVNESDKDPYYENLGIVTLEDVIEEIMQMEINDETDTLSDNRRKRRRQDAQVRGDFSQFTNLGTGEASANVVSPQLCLAAYQYLATTVKPFSPEFLSDSILKRLLSQRIFYKVKPDDDDSLKRLYTAKEPADYFIMILEGKVHVECGKENLFFDAGAFHIFGKKALTLEESPESMRNSRLENLSRRNSTTKPILSRRESVSNEMIGQRTSSNRHLDQIQKQGDGDLEMAIIATGNQGAKNPKKCLDYFLPDYTVDVITETSYLKVTRKDYITAVKATLVERSGPGLKLDFGDELVDQGGDNLDSESRGLNILSAHSTSKMPTLSRPKEPTKETTDLKAKDGGGSNTQCDPVENSAVEQQAISSHNESQRPKI